MKAVFISLLLPGIVCAQFFSKVTTGPLVNTPGDTRSVNWVDVNQDGLMDCFLSNGPSGGQNNFLFINNGGGSFTRITTDTITKDLTPSDGATFGDINNDGNPDACVVNWYNVNNLLYTGNTGGSFSRHTGPIVANDAGYSETASWGDYDNDGLLDLYVTNSAGNRKNFLYHNTGNATFTKIITGSAVNDTYYSRCVNWTDIDNDGDPDLFVTNESLQNENIYRNDGGGTFTALTSGPLLTNGGNTMSGSWGDYDNDGDMDVFLANDQGFNALFRNNGNFNFTKILNDTLVKTPARSFSSAWSDVDNDGDLDVFVTNAFLPGTKQVNFFYTNNGNGTFTRNTTDIITQDSAWYYGCAFADYDNDGFEDLAVATCRFAGVDQPDRLYHNNGNTNKWLTITLQGTISNRMAIGAKVRVKAIINGSPVWQMREITAQSAYCGQNDMRAHFGLGNATQADSIKIEWPSGIVAHYTQVSANQFVQYVETGTSRIAEADGAERGDLWVYPNPTGKQVNIELRGTTFDTNDMVTITDTKGTTLKSVKLNNSTRQLRFENNNPVLRPGQYVISVNHQGKVYTAPLLISISE